MVNKTKIVCYCSNQETVLAFMSQICSKDQHYYLSNDVRSIKEIFSFLKKEDAKLLIVDNPDTILIKELKHSTPNLKVAYLIDTDLKNVVIKEKIDTLKHFNAIQNVTYISNSDIRIWKNLIDNLYENNQLYISLETGLEIHTQSTTLERTGDVDSILDEIDVYLNECEVKHFQKDFFSEALTELLYNGIFDAPTTETGEKKYYGSDRAQQIEFDEHEQLEIKWGVNDKFLVGTIVDNMGTLYFQNILETIKKCFSGDSMINLNIAEGGGVGFFKILNAVSNLVVAVYPNKRTEVSFVIKRDISKRDFRANHKTIHFNVLY